MIKWKIRKGWEIAPWHEIVACYLDIWCAFMRVGMLEFKEWLGENKIDYLEKLENAEDCI
jgi:hypothetical protein